MSKGRPSQGEINKAKRLVEEASRLMKITDPVEMAEFAAEVMGMDDLDQHFWNAYGSC